VGWGVGARWRVSARGVLAGPLVVLVTSKPPSARVSRGPSVEGQDAQYGGRVPRERENDSRVHHFNTVYPAGPQRNMGG